MKRYFIGTLIILLLGLFSWAQEAKIPFDMKKAQEELEIMKGILRTTISFVTENTQKQNWNYLPASSIDSFYLSGQGAVFVISTSSLAAPSLTNISRVSEELEKHIQEANVTEQLGFLDKELALKEKELALKKSEARMESGSGSGSGGANEQTPPAPSSVAAPLAPPETPSSPQIDREALREKVLAIQATTKQRMEEAEANREKYLQNLEKIKGYLVEALANYGDSLTTVKPGEYVNVVLTDGRSDVGWALGATLGTGRQKANYDVISAQKSWITDYKAGRLSLEGFKQKVLQYSE